MYSEETEIKIMMTLSPISTIGVYNSCQEETNTAAEILVLATKHGIGKHTGRYHPSAKGQIVMLSVTTQHNTIPRIILQELI